MSEGAGLKDVPFLCEDMTDASREKYRHKQAEALLQPSPVPKEKHFLSRHLDTEQGWPAHVGQGQESNP